MRTDSTPIANLLLAGIACLLLANASSSASNGRVISTVPLHESARGTIHTTELPPTFFFAEGRVYSVPAPTERLRAESERSRASGANVRESIALKDGQSMLPSGAPRTPYGASSPLFILHESYRL